MRPHMTCSLLRPALLAAALFLAPALAQAEKAESIFVVDMSDGYGIDSCVAAGGACGQAIADAWCRVHDFERAVSFGKVTNDALKVSLSAKAVRTTSDTVAITCR